MSTAARARVRAAGSRLRKKNLRKLPKLNVGTQKDSRLHVNSSIFTRSLCVSEFVTKHMYRGLIIGGSILLPDQIRAPWRHRADAARKIIRFLIEKISVFQWKIIIFQYKNDRLQCEITCSQPPLLPATPLAERFVPVCLAACPAAAAPAMSAAAPAAGGRSGASAQRHGEAAQRRLLLGRCLLRPQPDPSMRRCHPHQQPGPCCCCSRRLYAASDPNGPARHVAPPSTPPDPHPTVAP